MPHFQKNTLERKLLDKYFGKTKQALSQLSGSNSQLALMVGGKDPHTKSLSPPKDDMIPWLDPRLAESAQRLLIYQNLKLKAIANEEKMRIE